MDFFFYLLWDKIWYLSGPVSNYCFNVFELLFLLKVSSQTVESPQIMDMAAWKAFQSIELSHFTSKDL